MHYATFWLPAQLLYNEFDCNYFLSIFFSFYQGALKDRQGRLITVTSTVTAFTYATATVTVATTQSLVFSSKALFCFPSNLVSSLSIKAC